MLAAGAGVGGGGLFVPILILILEFTTKTAIPLSNVRVPKPYVITIITAINIRL